MPADGLPRPNELCREVLGAAPQHAPALHLLGVLAHRAGHPDDAIALMQRAIAIDARTAEYHSNLGAILTARGRFDEAVAACGQAVSLRPDLPEAHYNLGNALRDARRLDEAAAAYERALSLRFGYAQAHNNLANVHKALGRIDEAIAGYRRAIMLEPGYAHACCNLAGALKDIGEVDEALALERRALETAPARPEIHSNLILGLHYPAHIDPRTIVEECRRFDERHALPLRASITPHANERADCRPLRIGFVSPDLRTHPVASFLLPILEARDRAGVRLTCFTTNVEADEVTDRLRAHCDDWVTLFGLSDDAAAARVRDDRIDILFDLSLHTAGNRLLLFARKPAPIQVTYLGLTGTTGLSTMDYRLTDRWLDPPGSESFSTERPLRLAESAWCYAPPPRSPDVVEPPAIRAGYVTFGCFNNLAKVTPPALDAWAAILNRVPGSRLVLKGAGFRSPRAVERFGRAFGERGIDASRVDLLPSEPLLAHLARYGTIDIALDTFPYNGLTTTCEALWMGVPVITLEGRHPLARVGVSLLTNAGLADLLAPGVDAYVERAVHLAADRARRVELRAGLRDRMRRSALMDAPRFARAFEAACRDIWRAWCAQAA